MKKTVLYFTAICFLTLTMSSCTKERAALDLLYGSWVLQSELDEDGIPIVLGVGVSREEITTFYRCSDKDNDACTGSTKTTITDTNGGSTQIDVYSDNFSYEVFQKEQITIDGEAFEITELKKKDFALHPVRYSKAVRTYSKQ